MPATGFQPGDTIIRIGLDEKSAARVEGRIQAWDEAEAGVGFCQFPPGVSQEEGIAFSSLCKIIQGRTGQLNLLNLLEEVPRGIAFSGQKSPAFL